MSKLFPNQKLNGFVFSNLIALSIIIGINGGTLKYFGDDCPDKLVYSEFVIIPVLMGIISALCWRNLNLTKAELITISCLNAFLAMNILLAIFLNTMFVGYAVIFLIIVSPLILTSIIAGALIGKAILKKTIKCPEP